MNRMRDWWRGYTDADLEKMREYMAAKSNYTPGSVMQVSRGEMNALTVVMRERRVRASAAGSDNGGSDALKDAPAPTS